MRSANRNETFYPLLIYVLLKQFKFLLTLPIPKTSQRSRMNVRAHMEAVSVMHSRSPVDLWAEVASRTELKEPKLSDRNRCLKVFANSTWRRLRSRLSKSLFYRWLFTLIKTGMQHYRKQYILIPGTSTKRNTPKNRFLTFQPARLTSKLFMMLTFLPTTNGDASIQVWSKKKTKKGVVRIFNLF